MAGTFEDIMASVEAAAAASTTPAAESVDTITGHLDAEQLKGMKMAELKALANDLGLKYAFNAKKETLIEMIVTTPVQTERAAIVEGDDHTAAEAAPGLIVEEGQVTAPTTIPTAVELEEDVEEEMAEEKLNGRVLITYSGMVNLRDENLAVVDQAMQGQVFRTTGKCEKNGATWYRVEDRHGKNRLISGDVVRYMA